MQEVHQQRIMKGRIEDLATKNREFLTKIEDRRQQEERLLSQESTSFKKGRRTHSFFRN